MIDRAGSQKSLFSCLCTARLGHVCLVSFSSFCVFSGIWNCSNVFLSVCFWSVEKQLAVDSASSDCQVLTVPPIWSPFLLRYVNRGKNEWICGNRNKRLEYSILETIQWLPRIASLLTVPPIWSPFVLRYVNHGKHNKYMAVAKKDQNILSYRRHSIQWLPRTASVLTVPPIWSPFVPRHVRHGKREGIYGNCERNKNVFCGFLEDPTKSC